MSELNYNEIVTAMEWCYGGTSDNCRNCPLEGVAFCIDRLEDESIKLIKKQKEEIEKLRYLRVGINTVVDLPHALENAKVEATEELIKRLKELAVWDSLGDTKIVYEHDIDKLIERKKNYGA